jgi:glucose-1-phosphate thymidylyltransferase
VNDRINIAIADASLEDEPDAGCRRSTSRYLASVANMPLIAHVIHSLADDGIEHVVVVSSDTMQERLASAVVAANDRGITTSFVATDTGDPLVPRLRREVGDAPVLVHSADCLFPEELPRLRSRFQACGLDLAVLMRPPAAGEREDGQSHLRVDLPRDEPEGTAFVFGPRAWPELERLGDGALRLRRLVQCMEIAGHSVGVSQAQQYWCYEHSMDRLLAANRMLLDALPTTAMPASDDCVFEGRVAQCPSARVSRSRLRGPVLIGEGAVVEDSFIGPYTAIGPGAVVVGAEVEYTMVLAGAQVRYPRYPLEASVIGERAVVSQSFGLPAGLHLELGPDARVILG